MAKTEVRGGQVKDTSIQRSDLDTVTAGLAVVAKIIQGSGVTLSSTGADAGTGDVTINIDAGVNSWKQPVHVATTAAGTLATSFENGDVIDGVTLATGDRILIKNQAAGAENGIYTVNASGAPTRTADADASTEFTSGTAVVVEEGVTNADSAWLLTTNSPITLDTTALIFQKIASVGFRPAVVIGSDITVFGHSYLTGGGVSYVDKQYITQLGGMLRAKLFDLALGGSQAANDQSWLGVTNSQGGFGWVLQNYNPSSSAAPYTPANTLPFIHFGHNDLQQHSHDGTGNPRTIFKTAIRTILSRLGAARIFENTDSSVAYGVLTWQAACPSTFRNSGTSYRPVPGNTATITITLPADYDGSPVAIGFTVYPTSDGTITFSGTAGVTGTVNFADLAYSANGTLFRRNSSNCHTHRITSLTSANAGQTIIMTVSGVSATTFSTPAQLTGLSTNGTAGATTYGYRHAYRTYNGDTIYSTERTIATGNATLSATNSINIPAGAAWPSGVEKELIIRTTGGATQGIINVLNAPAAFTDIGYPAVAYTTNSANPLINGFSFDFWQIEASNPVIRGVVVGLNKIPNAGYVNSATDTDVDNYNADLASVIAEFAANQWLLVDADAILSKTTAYFAADNVHPNNRGHFLLAQGIYNAIAAWSETWTLDNIAAQSRTAKGITSRQWVKLYWSSAGQATGSDMALTSTLTEVDATLKRTRLAINAEVGDEIEVYVGGMVSNAAVAAQFDIATIDAAGAVINYFSTGTPTQQPGGQNLPQIFAQATNLLLPISGTAVYKVQANDIITLATVPGQVQIMLMARASSARTLYGGGNHSSPPLEIHLKNLSQRNFGFNGS